MRIIVGITGSSGAEYAREFLKQCEADKFLIVSKWGKILLKDELGIKQPQKTSWIRSKSQPATLEDMRKQY